MVQGGATGMIEVEGIANIQPAVADLPERFIILRDQQFEESAIQRARACPRRRSGTRPINYVPVTFPQYKTAKITMQRAPGVLARRQCRRQHDHGPAGAL